MNFTKRREQMRAVLAAFLFQLYHDTAKEEGYESGPQNIGYLWKVHVDETEELAEETARKYVQGPSTPFLAGNEGTTNKALLSLPGLTSRKRVLATRAAATANRGGMASGDGEDRGSHRSRSDAPKDRDLRSREPGQRCGGAPRRLRAGRRRRRQPPGRHPHRNRFGSYARACRARSS